MLDSCVSKAACLYLRNAGHDVEYSAEWPADPGDAEILERAAAERRALVTVDKDFGDLAVRHNRQHAGIVRLVGFRAGEQGAATDTVATSQIVALREKRGLTQRGLAKLLGTSQPYVAKLESGRVKNLGIQTLVKCAHALGASVVIRMKPTRRLT